MIKIFGHLGNSNQKEELDCVPSGRVPEVLRFWRSCGYIVSTGV